MTKPDFICVGLPKTGTSWLYAVLKRHKEVDLPLFKELNYYYQDSFLFKRSIFAMFFHKDWYNKQRRFKLQQRLYAFIKNLTGTKTAGMRNNFLHILYLFFPRSRYLYRQLFEKGYKISGDISPLYSTLKKEIIEDVYKSNPDLKTIMIFRDPVERLWSHIKMDLPKDQLFSDGILVLDNIKPYLDRRIMEYSYHKLYENWTGIFPASQLGLFFYDDLKEDVESFYKSICFFLGIDPEKLDGNRQAIIDRVVLKGDEIEITPVIFNYILTNYREDLEKLYKLFPDQRIKSWLEVNIKT